MNYENFINFNQNISELKNWNQGIKLIQHIISNINRKTDRELLNPEPEIKQMDLIPLNLKTIEKEIEQTKDFKKGGKGAKPYRFITSTLNVEPTKENEAMIKEWGNEMLKLYSKYFNIKGASIHTNETRPHLHIVVKNFNNKEWGNFVNGKKIKLSGPEGKELVKKIWKEGEEINKKLAEKYHKEFRQEATTEKGRDRTIQRFRAMDWTKAKPEDIKKLVEWAYQYIDQLDKKFPKQNDEWKNKVAFELCNLSQMFNITYPHYNDKGEKYFDPISIADIKSLDFKTIENLFKLIKNGILKKLQKAINNNPIVKFVKDTITPEGQDPKNFSDQDYINGLKQTFDEWINFKQKEEFEKNRWKQPGRVRTR